MTWLTILIVAVWILLFAPMVALPFLRADDVEPVRAPAGGSPGPLGPVPTRPWGAMAAEPAGPAGGPHGTAERKAA